MARLAARLVRRTARKPPAAAEDLGGGLYPQRHRHRRRLFPAGRAGAGRAPRPGHRRLRSLDAGRVMRAAALAGFATLLLAACNKGAPEPEAQATEIPSELAGEAARPPQPAQPGEEIGTPMAERMATLGLLNKRNNIT